MIRSFRDKRTAALFQGIIAKGVPTGLAERAKIKLLMLDAAVSLDDLRVPPGNRLEKLSGRRAGQHSIRVNEQWRLCFRWRDGGADDVEFVDYH
ncbi:MAG: type II toxin-antitoxin system RelE/ParE family toxin [Alphaproteobacteria bacterium]|nr:type II toxin-antitoxin system RelE/ParE family toxin [Alphaproteobacteria bacterium]